MVFKCTFLCFYHFGNIILKKQWMNLIKLQYLQKIKVIYVDFWLLHGWLFPLVSNKFY